MALFKSKLIVIIIKTSKYIYIAWWWQAKTAIVFWARCIKCAFAKTQIESKHCVKWCGLRRIIRCDGFESKTITTKLLSSVKYGDGDLLRIQSNFPDSTIHLPY